jgi:asparagine synthase (glutamine-hydrolysing)
MGFVTPISGWFRGPLAAEARALAASPTLARTGWFDMSAIEQMVSAHQSGRSEYGRPIWQFFMLEKSLQRLFGI